MSLESRMIELNGKARNAAFSWYLRKGFVPSHLKEIIKAMTSLQSLRKYSPDQPRVPAGCPEGGEWCSGDDEESENMNIDDAVKKLNAQAKKISGGKCATFVREAIQAGGVDLQTPYPASAKDYGPYLEQYGFEAVTPTPSPNYSPEKGDIAVIQPYPGGRPDGHIEMYNGTQWVSDFFQNGKDIWPGPGYRQSTPSYEVYRQ
jgi:hypothetical protein